MFLQVWQGKSKSQRSKRKNIYCEQIRYLTSLTAFIDKEFTIQPHCVHVGSILSKHWHPAIRITAQVLLLIVKACVYLCWTKVATVIDKTANTAHFNPFLNRFLPLFFRCHFPYSFQHFVPCPHCTKKEFWSAHCSNN